MGHFGGVRHPKDSGLKPQMQNAKELHLNSCCLRLTSMGWEDGSKLLRVSGDTPSSLEELRGKRVAIGISPFLYNALRAKGPTYSAAAQFFTVPHIPVTAILLKLKKLVACLLKKLR